MVSSRPVVAQSTLCIAFAAHPNLGQLDVFVLQGSKMKHRAGNASMVT